MELRFQRKGLHAFDASVLGGNVNSSANASRRPAAAPNGNNSSTTTARMVTLLDLSHNNITGLANMHLLSQLKTLYVGYNKLTSLTLSASSSSTAMGSSSLYTRQTRGGASASVSSPLSSTLSVPPSITRLDISFNRITSVASLASLPNLVSLNVSNQGVISSSSGIAPSASSSPTSSVVFDTSTLRFLPNTIAELDISGLGLTTLAPIAHLYRLHRLDAGHNALAMPDSLAPLRKISSTLEHLVIEKNPICPRSLSVSPALIAFLLGSADMQERAQLGSAESPERDGGSVETVGVVPLLLTLNGALVESFGAAIRLNMSANNHSHTSNRHHNHENNHAQVSGVYHTNGTATAMQNVSVADSASVSTRRREPQPSLSAGHPAIANGNHRSDSRGSGAPTTALYRDAAANLFSEDEVNASFTPEFGVAITRGVPQRPTHSIARTALDRSRGGRSSVGSAARASQHSRLSERFAIDVDGIRLQEMERLLAELTQREEGLKRTVRTQKLSISANAKVAAEQRTKLEALIELEEDMVAELGGLEAQLHALEAEKAAHDETLILSKIAYAR